MKLMLQLRRRTCGGEEAKHANRRYHFFEAIAIGGTLRTSKESLEAGWFSPGEAIEKVTHLAQKQKLQDALNSGKGVIYRVYRTNPYELLQTVIV
ncbi:MAG: hypothetical protein ACE5NM_02350 [Sedimentisphaerales bacterium]